MRPHSGHAHRRPRDPTPATPTDGHVTPPPPRPPRVTRSCPRLVRPRPPPGHAILPATRLATPTFGPRDPAAGPPARPLWAPPPSVLVPAREPARMAAASRESAPLGLVFERLFLAGRRLPTFPWTRLEEKLKNSSNSTLLLDILQKTVLHPLSVRHPPSAKYARCFLAELIRRHESAHAEPLDELYEALARVLTAEDSPQCHRSYLLPSGDSVTLCESTAIVSQGTTGLVTWDAALYLAEWALGNPAVFRDRTILELGSGAGLTGLVVCKACGPDVYVFSDCHGRVLQQLRRNLGLNGFPAGPVGSAPSPGPGPRGPRVAAVELDWARTTPGQLTALRPDVILAADVLYDPEVIPCLVGVLRKLSACRADPSPPEGYVAYTVRDPRTCRLFQAELDKAGIGWETIPSHRQTLFPYEPHSRMGILKLSL
ncbi:protein-lysine N-methyltransferase EEF2KMT [Tachyglossus aculeatus]|uniref:protein-lysine N-methyltransferase EEF2KMT n=1 Tax=Tachyglossus aculeatus TaxID=9261 RepID=UPI0018F3645E|nr:protein-lysine N-methyltransferase EEF2KMT [Tachyglossus aculeatus]